MYIESATQHRKGKTYSKHLLRTSFRENGKVKHKTIANLSSCLEDEIRAIKLALKHKNNLSELGSVQDIKTVLGKRIGVVWALTAVAQRLGITKALGRDLEGKLALVQVVARMINQGSRLSAVRLAQLHSICEVIGVGKLGDWGTTVNIQISREAWGTSFSK